MIDLAVHICIDDVNSGMELYGDCSDDCSYFARVRTIAEKTENKVDMRTSLLCIFQNARSTELYFVTRFILESVLKRVDFNVNIALIKIYNYYHNVTVKCDYSITIISVEGFPVKKKKACITHREYVWRALTMSHPQI